MKKSLFSIVAVSAVILSGCGARGVLLTPSCDYVEAASLEPDQRKQLEQMQDSLLHARALRAVNSHDFIIEADQLMFKRGRTANVSSLTNFVSLFGDRATVQVAPFAAGGPNGVGGITLDGRPSGLSIRTDKNGYTILSMNVSGTAISATVTLQLYPKSNRGEVTVVSNFHSQRVTLRGRIIPTQASNAYKGYAL